MTNKNLDPAAYGAAGHRIGAIEDINGRITDIYADNTGAAQVLLLADASPSGDRVLDLEAAAELIIYLGLAIARARDPRPGR